MDVDPVCGMNIEPENAAGVSEYKGNTYIFCSEECKERFDENPGRYLGQHGERSARSASEE